MKTLLAVLAAVVLVPATASAATITRFSAPVEATLEYHDRDDRPGKVADRLTIVREGTVLFDAKPEPDGCDARFCGPTVGFGRTIPPLSVADLEGDEEPEVIYQAYTGGARCCFAVQIYSLNDRIRRDARRWRKLYVRIRDDGTGAQLGPVAAWAADRYRLGKRDATLRLLKRHADRGFLRGPGRVQGRRFVRRLDGFLLRLGYADGSD